MATRFDVGEIVEAVVSAQGLIQGQRYRITSATKRRHFTGTYVSYTVEPVDRSLATPKRPIGNAPMVLRTIDGSCDGCSEQRETKPYDVTFTDGRIDRAHYCEDCAELARMNWNGETASIELAEENR